MNHGSLFSGIGGFDLAAEWMGWNNIFHCEWNEFGQQVLNHYWPNAKSYGDITTTDFSIHNGEIDILTGGFPCQPYSQAGKRRGKEDERHLWPEMLRAIREIEPRWIVGENVYGVVNWNEGVVFEEVQTDLEDEGYKLQPYILPAVSVNAPHRRDRVWFVATNAECISRKAKNKIFSKWESIKSKSVDKSSAWNATNTNNTGTRKRLRADGNGQKENEGREGQPQLESWQESGNGDVTHAESSGRKTRPIGQRKIESWGGNESMGARQWDRFPTQSPVCRRDDGLSEYLDTYTFSKWRRESIKAYGNAIVPQVAFQIFKTIQKYEAL